MKESDILKQIIDYLKSRHFIVIRTNSGRINIGQRWIRLADAGTSDLTCMDRHGRFIAIETKRPGKELMTEQKRYKRDVLSGNGIFIKADCLQDVIDNIDVSIKEKKNG